LLFYLLILHWKQDTTAGPHQCRHTCNTTFIARIEQKSRSTVTETATENLKIHKSPDTDKLSTFYQFWKILTHYQWTGTAIPINLSASTNSLISVLCSRILVALDKNQFLKRLTVAK
jgi:hypothetical protein